MANWKALKAKDDAWNQRFDAWKSQQPEIEQIIDCSSFCEMNDGNLDMNAWKAQCLRNDAIVQSLRKRYIATVEPFWLKGSFVDICPR